MEHLNFLNEKAQDTKDEIDTLVLKNGAQMYEGIYDVIDELEKDVEWWNERYEELLEDDDDEDFISMVLWDDFDRELMERYGKKFYDNLIKLGYNYKFDEDEGEGYWDIKDKYNDELTCYGVVWELWYSLDTDVRETVSEIWEESFS